MTAENKRRKVSKKLHWGRGGGFLKARLKGIKGLDFFNASQRLKIKKETNNEINQELIIENKLNIKNWDKLKTDLDRESVLYWSKITTVTINNDGRYTMDIIPQPGFNGAKLTNNCKE